MHEEISCRCRTQITNLKKEVASLRAELGRVKRDDEQVPLLLLRESCSRIWRDFRGALPEPAGRFPVFGCRAPVAALTLALVFGWAEHFLVCQRRRGPASDVAVPEKAPSDRSIRQPRRRRRSPLPSDPRERT